MTVTRWRPGVGSGMAPALIALLIASAPATAPAQMAARARQVTIFGVIATPNSQSIDPKLEKIEPQLRKLLPNHGFKLIDVKSKRLMAGEDVRCELGGGYVASATLMRPTDTEGKVRLRCDLLFNEVVQFQTNVATPPNQLFFCDRMFPSGERLLIGIGAR